MLTWACQCLVWYVLQSAGLVLGRDYVVHDKRFYRSLVFGGSLGLGESYMRGDWSSPDLRGFFVKLCSSSYLQWIQQVWGWVSPLEWWRWFTSHYFNSQTLIGSRKVGKEHYDLDHTMYERMLSTPMLYSCAYWRNVETLEEAQHQKIMLLGRKLQLTSGMSVLDIGCGWGDLAITFAKEFGCTVTGLTISEQQRKVAEQRAEAAGVSDKVVFILQDYREHSGLYDRVVSVGMLEHVGFHNLTTYFQCVKKFLREGGLAVIHSITGRTNTSIGDAWTNRYIFPNSAIPSHDAWITSLRPVELEIEDIQNLGHDYSRTLSEWRKRFDAQCANELDLHFVRMWHYYLTTSEVQFAIRGLQLWQVVLSNGRRERYDAPR